MKKKHLKPCPYVFLLNTRHLCHTFTARNCGKNIILELGAPTKTLHANNIMAKSLAHYKPYVVAYAKIKCKGSENTKHA